MSAASEEQQQVGQVKTDKPTKTKPGAAWKADERHVLPKNRRAIVFTGLMLTVFLAALDQVRLPPTASSLGRSQRFLGRLS